jgi:hypothetical protein
MERLPLSYQPYRIPINPALLLSGAEQLLSEADRREGLLSHLGWAEMPPELEPGFNPQSNTKDFPRMMKKSMERRTLKEARVGKGFDSLAGPRKGLKGWIQGRFHDQRELNLPIDYDLLNWIANSPRYHLLGALHDAILSLVATGEPHLIALEEALSFTNPVTDIIVRGDVKEAERLAHVLGLPLKKVDPTFLVDGIANFVLVYHRERSSAFYFGS